MKLSVFSWFSLMIVGCMFPVAVLAEEINRDARWHKNIANSSIRLESGADMQASKIEFLEPEEMNAIFPENSVTDGEISLQFAVNEDPLKGTPPVSMASPWKWHVTHFSQYQRDDGTQVTSTLPAGAQTNSARRELPFEDENPPVAATTVSGTVANISVYTEFGITGGDIEEVDSSQIADTGLSGDEIDSAINQDLAGYYVSSGANMGVGNWTIGVQAGYETAVGNVVSHKKSSTTYSSAVDSRELLGNVQSSRSMIVQPTTQTTAITAQDLFQLVYFQGSADAAFSEKLGLKFGALCFAVPEMLVSTFEGSNQNGYGFEIFGDVNYQLGKSLNYTLYLNYALTDEYFSDDSIYQILHKLELKF
ncbi:hypothetical protein U14_00421 [Candidatus Moduliflexus flocculans]|uniref:Uncharacterized protein n=1 Tax=Candidatus Moduliflexus flocculans TaxID=1499966 RepID=A0A0S6VVE1_9BACT|nr:hypothetical protein U14_00421 [Candidatus Moduliflexus flocculans]